MRSVVPDISWLGRVFETSEHMGIGVDHWAAVTLVGDREEHESEDTPPRGMRVSIFNSEAEARVAAAKALKEAHGAAALSPVQRKYAQRRLGNDARHCHTHELSLNYLSTHLGDRLGVDTSQHT